MILHSVFVEDVLGLYSINVEYLPQELWSEAEDEIHLTVTVVNFGPDIVAVSLPDNTIYSVKQFLSKDAVFDGEDIELDLKLEEGHLYDHRQNIRAGEHVVSETLTGEMIIYFYHDCYH